MKRRRVLIQVMVFVCHFWSSCCSLSQWNCPRSSAFCFVIANQSLDWDSAYEFCTKNGGDVYHSQPGNLGTSYLEEWMKYLDPSLNGTLIWTSLRRTNGHWNWRTYTPDYTREYFVTWAAGDSNRHGLDCAMTNRSGILRRASCRDNAATICMRNASLDLSKLNHEDPKISVKLVASHGNVEDGIIVVNRSLINDPSFKFDCQIETSDNNISSRLLFYSWVKDDVYLSLYRSRYMTPRYLHDSSKLNSDRVTSYHLQGTFHCEVQQLGSSRRVQSNRVILLLEEVVTGVLTFHSWNNVSSSVIDSRRTDFIKTLNRILLDRNINSGGINWDELSVIYTDSGLRETKFHIYVEKLGQNARAGFMDAVTQRFSGDLSWFTKRADVVEANIKWTLRCANYSQSFRTAEGTEDTVVWSPAWHGQMAQLHGGKHPALCVRKDNGAVRIRGPLCVADFVQGARLTTEAVCNGVLHRNSPTCYPGYRWVLQANYCVKQNSQTMTWNESVASCINHWPVNLMSNSTQGAFLWNPAVLNEKLKLELPDEFWLPVRRSSFFGRFHNYLTPGNKSENIMDNIQPHNLQIKTEPSTLDECVSFNAGKSGTNISYAVRFCDDFLPSVCISHPVNNLENFQNLCPEPWFGFGVRDGRLTCLRKFTSKDVSWNDAEKLCKEAKFDIPGAALNLATFQDDWSIMTSNLSGLVNETTWIGLSWSENFKKYCWTNEENCEFQTYQWDESETFQLGRQVGALTNQLSWILLPSFGRLDTFLCQAVVNLTLDEKIKVTVQESGTEAQVHLVRSSLENDDSERYSIDQILNSTISSKTPAWTQIESVVSCYYDGELASRSLVSLQQSFSRMALDSTVFHCDGWIGWPLKFYRSEAVTAQTAGRYSYIALVETTDMFSTSVTVDKSYHFNFVNLVNRHRQRVERLLDPAFPHVGSLSVRILRFRLTEKNETKVVSISVLIDTSVLGNSASKSEQGIYTTAVKYLSRNGTLNTYDGHVYRLVYLRSRRNCPREVSIQTNVTWPSVNIASLTKTEELCYLDEMEPLLRRCGGDVIHGATWEPISEKFNESTGCFPLSANLQIIRQLTEDLAKGRVNSSQVFEQLCSLANRAEGNLSLAEVREMSEVAYKSLQRTDLLQSKDFAKLGMLMDMVLKTNRSDLEKMQQVPQVSNTMVDMVEKVMSKVTVDNETNQAEYRNPHMVFQIVEVPNDDFVQPRHFEDTMVGFTASKLDSDATVLANISKVFSRTPPEDFINNDVTVRLPVQELQAKFNQSSRVRYSFAVARDSRFFNAKENQTIYSETGKPQEGYQLDSVVILTEIQNQPVTNLQETVKIFFKSQSNQPSGTPQCVYWEKTIPPNTGGWSKRGCVYRGLNSTNNVHVCECNHLTPFAMLIPYIELSPTDRTILSIVTIMGCSLSVLGLSFVIITFLIHEKWRKPLGNKILFNLSLALLALFATYLGGSQLVLSKELCKTSAAATHYFLLASFNWMLVESIYQYLCFVKVIGAKAYVSRFMRKAAPVAWGCPIVPIIGVLIHNSDLYLDSGYRLCWIKLEAFYYVVLIPVASIVFINILVFVAILKNVLCRAKVPSNQDQTSMLLNQFRMAVCVFFLLGLGWTFGFLAVGEMQLVFTYLFCIFNSLQGFAIFGFYVLRERSARAFWSNLFSVCGMKPNNSVSSRNHSKQSESNVVYKMTRM